jgi:hypothetical protein
VTVYIAYEVREDYAECPSDAHIVKSVKQKKSLLTMCDLRIKKFHYSIRLKFISRKTNKNGRVRQLELLMV